MLTESQMDAFDLIYRTDLVYRTNCHTLCGDGHCCHFSRYKPNAVDRHLLVLLPGEYEFMRERGYLDQFPSHTHVHLDFALDEVTLTYDAIDVARPSSGCACSHDIRPTLCRLYPLIPIYARDGKVEGIDTNFALIEELESIHGTARACPIDELPFDQVDKFFTIANAIGKEPLWRFHVAAYRLVKTRSAETLRRQSIPKGRAAADLARAWHHAHLDLMTGKLFDAELVRSELDSLASEYLAEHYQ